MTQLPTRPYPPQVVRQGIEQRVQKFTDESLDIPWCPKCKESRGEQVVALPCFVCGTRTVKRPKSLPMGHEDFKLVIMTLAAISGDKGKNQGGRYAILNYLFPGKWESVNHVTTKSLTEHEKRALYIYIQPKYDKSVTNSKDRLQFSPHIQAELLAILFEVGYKAPKVEPKEEENRLQTFNKLRKEGASKYIMQCGHPNDGYSMDEKPVCSRCVELPGSRLVDFENPDFKVKGE